MSKKVEIYDQYSPVYSDSENNNELTTVYTKYDEALDTIRYTLVHPSSGFTTTEGTNLSDQDANALVESLYNSSKTFGTEYTDKSIKLEKGYAEIIIKLEDGKHLNRVIYTVVE